MSINLTEYTNKDLYVDDPFEEVMFRRENKTGNIYRKFYSSTEYSEPIHFSNKLYFEATQSGRAISKEEYENGKKQTMFNE